MAGAVLILLVLFVIGPFAVFVGGAIWSALLGAVLTEEVDGSAGAQDSASAA